MAGQVFPTFKSKLHHFLSVADCQWCSLFQRPRSGEVEEIFKRSLKNVNLWYAHAMVMCWLLTRVPEAVKPYEERGWPNFEQGVSCFIKDHTKVLDIGKLKECCTTWWSLLESCTAGRLPPMAPHQFSKVLDTKTFTNGADCEMVKGKYEKFKDKKGI